MKRLPILLLVLGLDLLEAADLVLRAEHRDPPSGETILWEMRVPVDGPVVIGARWLGDERLLGIDESHFIRTLAQRFLRAHPVDLAEIDRYLPLGTRGNWHLLITVTLLDPQPERYARVLLGPGDPVDPLTADLVALLLYLRGVPLVERHGDEITVPGRQGRDAPKASSARKPRAAIVGVARLRLFHQGTSSPEPPVASGLTSSARISSSNFPKTCGP